MLAAAGPNSAEALALVLPAQLVGESCQPAAPPPNNTSGPQAHSPALARHLKLRCKGDHRVLLSSEGPFSSVIKVGWAAGLRGNAD